MKPRLGRPRRDRQNVGDLGERQAEVEVQDDHGALIDVQAFEATLELIAVGERHGAVVRARRVRFEQVYLDQHASFLAPGVAIAGANQQPMHPGVETIRIAETAHVLPGFDEGILDGVLGAVRIAKDQAGDRVEPGDRRARQL